MITRDSLVNECMKYLGVRYVHQGSTTYGLDCRGLLLRVVEDLKLVDENFSQQKFYCYPTSPIDNRFHSVIEEYCIKIDILDAREGDILLFKFKEDAQHIAFILKVYESGKSWKIIHSTQRSGVIEHDINERWIQFTKTSIVGCYSLPNVE